VSDAGRRITGEIVTEGGLLGITPCQNSSAQFAIQTLNASEVDRTVQPICCLVDSQTAFHGTSEIDACCGLEKEAFGGTD
jgi:hypothetical protein